MTKSSRVIFPASVGLLVVGSSWSLPVVSSPSAYAGYVCPTERVGFHWSDSAFHSRFTGNEPGMWSLPAAPTPNRPIRVSVSAHDQSVRKVLWNLFSQGRRPFKMGADIQGNVTIDIKQAGFGYALSKTLEASQPPLACEIRNGVYQIHPTIKSAK